MFFLCVFVDECYCFRIRRRQWHPTPVLLPWKSHGWRSLEGCSPWGRGELDTTERLHFHFSLSHIGEGNGNPLQCSCLENPRDGGACWVAIYGVAQSQTWLKWLHLYDYSKDNFMASPYIYKIFSRGLWFRKILIYLVNISANTPELHSSTYSTISETSSKMRNKKAAQTLALRLSVPFCYTEFSVLY